MGALQWLGRGVRRLVILIGATAWVGIVLFATLAAWMSVYADTDLSQWAQRLAYAVGVPLLLVGSIVVLRISGRLADFALTLAFALLLCAYGSGGLQSLGEFFAGAPLWLFAAAAGAALLAIGVAALLSERVLPFAGAAVALLLVGSLSFMNMASAPTEMAADYEPPLAEAPLTESPSAAEDYASPPSDWSFAIPEPGDDRSDRDLAPYSPGNGEFYERLPQAAPPPPPPEALSPLSPSDFVMEELRFNKPERMRINRTYVVEAQIGVPQAQTLGDVGATETRDVEILANRLVRVELISDDFEVEQIHEVENVRVLPGTTGHWSWRVTPKRGGADRRMLLQVFGVMREGGFEDAVLVQTYEETIAVDVTALDRVQLVAQGFLVRWDMIAGVFGAIGGIWMFVSNVLKFLRRRQGEATAA